MQLEEAISIVSNVLAQVPVRLGEVTKIQEAINEVFTAARATDAADS